MRVLVACEFSGVVREAFRRRGHDAWSCDLLQAEDESEFHIQDDVINHLRGWDLIIAHPPCTYLTIAAEWAYGDGPYHQKVKPRTLVGEARRLAREDAVCFARAILEAEAEMIALENPIGVLSTRVREPDQIIQPWAFGEDASKATCLWLKKLKPLIPTDYVAPRLGKGGRPVWSNQTNSGQNRLSPSDTRAQERSRTYKGIAEAMAEQWGVLGTDSEPSR